MSIKKLRIRRAGKEVELESYAALQGYDMFQEQVVTHMISGVITRSYDGLIDEVMGGIFTVAFVDARLPQRFLAH